VGYAWNARTHTEEQVKLIADNIERFGFTMPVIVDEQGVLIAGHARVMAAKLRGLDEIPGIIIKAGEWSEEDKRAYRIWDNQSALLSNWDWEALRLELGDLRNAGFNLAPLGFDVAELAAILDVRPIGAIRMRRLNSQSLLWPPVAIYGHWGGIGCWRDGAN